MNYNKYNNIGTLIKRERESVDLSQKELAEMAGYNSYQTLLKIEKGERNITINDLYRISKALNLNPEYFIKYSDKNEKVVLWRERKDSKESKIIENRFKTYIANYRHLTEFLGINYHPFVPPTLDELKNIINADKNEDKYKLASLLAEKIRNEYNLGDYPASNLEREINDRGILIFYFDMNNSGSAASYVSKEGTAILLNKKDAPWRKHFDIAHELYHILMWNYNDFESKNYNLSKKDIEEKLANTFAAELLMPSNIIKKEIALLGSLSKIDSAFIVESALKFKVSMEAIVSRLEFLKFIKKDKKSNLIDDDSKRIFWKQYKIENPDESNGQDEFPFSYFMLVFSAYKRLKISKMKMAEYLNKNIGEIDFYLKEKMDQ